MNSYKHKLMNSTHRVKNKVLWVVLAIGVVGWNLSKAQDVVPPSPDASALIKNINIPVDLSTGVPNIQVPLFTLPTKRGLSVPVGLNYHASGIKVREISSVVGTGWQLAAGGAITRLVRGKHDFPDKRDKCPESQVASTNPYTQANCDPTPDLFYFSFPGRSGRFYLDDNANAFTQPYQNVLIGFQTKIFTPDSGHEGHSNNISFYNWKITDEHGYQYIFGDSNDAVEESLVDRQISGYLPEHYETTWYLTKIKSPDGTEIATFDYSEEIEVTQTDKVQTITRPIIDPGNSQIHTNYISGINLSEKNITNITRTRHLTKITTSFGTIDFSYAADRQDLSGGWRLDEITMRDYLGAFVQSYELVQDYFKGLNSRYDPYGPGGGEPLWENGIYNQDYINAYGEPPVRRLRLSKIIQNGTSEVMEFRRFTYNMDVGLPDYDSDYIDHYGYYNGSDLDGTYTSNFFTGAASLIPNLNLSKYGIENTTCGGQVSQLSTDAVFNQSCSSDHTELYLNSADLYPGRGSDFDDATANILKEIHLPTGGYQKLTYEPSGYHAMGIRIQKISDIDENGNEVASREFKYDNEFVISKPVYHYVQEDWGSGITTLYVSSNSFTNVFDTNGSPIRYGKVTVINKDGSYVVKEFTTQPDDQSTVQNYRHGVAYGSLITTIPHTSKPFAPPSSRFWERGLLDKETYYEVYDENEPNPKEIREVDYQYTTSTSIENTTYGYNGIHYATTSDDKIYINVGREKHVSKPIFLQKVTEKTYDQTSDDYITSITDYVYDATELQLVKTTSYNPAEDIKYIQENKYITHSDYDNNWYVGVAACESERNNCNYDCGTDAYEDPNFDSSACMDACNDDYDTCIGLLGTPPGEDYFALSVMESKHMISSVVEQQNFVERNSTKTLVSATLNLYKREGGNDQFIRPATSWYVDKRMSSSSHTSSYVNSSAQFVKSNNFRLANTYISYDQSNGNLLSESDISGITTSYEWGYNNNLVTATNVNPGANQIRSEATYKPLVGVLTQKDPNGYVTRYEYDDFNRLQLIKDHDGNIVQAYDYNYAQPPFLYASPSSLSFTSSGSGQQVNVGSNVTWSISSDSWINTSTSGNVITVSPTTNGSLSPRQGNITISDTSGAGLTAQSIAVSQEGATPTLSVSPNYVNMSDNGFFYIDLQSNTGWEIVYIDIDYGSTGYVNPTTYTGTGDEPFLEFEVVGFSYGNYLDAEIIIQTTDQTITKSIYVYVD